MDFIVVVGLVPVSPKPPVSGRTTVLRGVGPPLPPLPQPPRSRHYDHFHHHNRPLVDELKPEVPRELLAPSTDLLSRWDD